MKDYSSLTRIHTHTHSHIVSLLHISSKTCTFLSFVHFPTFDRNGDTEKWVSTVGEPSVPGLCATGFLAWGKLSSVVHWGTCVSWGVTAHLQLIVTISFESILRELLISEENQELGILCEIYQISRLIHIFLSYCMDKITSLCQLNMA